MTRRTAVITGASSGVGRSAALLLAAEGWNVIGLGRDAARCREAEAAIRAAAEPGAEVHFVQGDLAAMADVRQMAGAVLERAGAIHALLNNAGGVRQDIAITAEGLEATFAGNHLGPFLLTRLLLPRLRETAQSAGPGRVRIVNTSSEGHKSIAAIDWDDLQRTNSWTSGGAYSQAKLYNMLFTLELAKREAAYGITAHAIHPGAADSSFSLHATAEMKAYIASLDLISPDVGGRTLAWLASSEAGGRSTGGYYFDCEAVEPSALARDAEAAKQLWEESERYSNSNSNA